MSDIVKALVITSEEPASVMKIVPGGNTLRTLVGGWLEGVYGASDDWHAYCDDEGKLKGSPVNRTATNLAHALGWPAGDILCGSVVFLGSTEDGEEADVPEHVVEKARTMGYLDEVSAP